MNILPRERQLAICQKNLGESVFDNSGYLASFDNYHLTRNNSRFDMDILHCHLWGGCFAVSVIEERQVTSGNGSNF